jgi:hypothetical protein
VDIKSDDILTSKANQAKVRQVVICPDCSAESNVSDGVLPLSCSVCGYFFQAGIDKIIGVSDSDDKKTKNNTADDVKPQEAVVQPVSQDINKGPLPSAKKDTSSLRLTAITSNHMLPETMKEAGNVIGKNGTTFRAFRSEQQISIWHTAAGWYARAIMGTALYNWVPMNQGIQVKLSAGDLLIVDQEQFMVEII